ncbi:hypothetical protein Y032_0081g1420 [Ancylostoma ceylanicum]|uniref:Uncharacterized protein n=1 Tax=Ancylostoma ceylanicum TaxID=53326 RepID=A0A016TR77_9BILA|nr:hypothetical protein Y032_0081g1420 [Ancylostoma ceylanicum]
MKPTTPKTCNTVMKVNRATAIVTRSVDRQHFRRHALLLNSCNLPRIFSAKKTPLLPTPLLAELRDRRVGVDLLLGAGVPFSGDFFAWLIFPGLFLSESAMRIPKLGTESLKSVNLLTGVC